LAKAAGGAPAAGPALQGWLGQLILLLAGQPRLPASPRLDVPVVAGHPGVDRAYQRLLKYAPREAALLRQILLRTLQPDVLGQTSLEYPRGTVVVDPLQHDAMMEDSLALHPPSYAFDETLRHEAQHQDQYRRMGEAGWTFWQTLDPRLHRAMEDEAYAVDRDYTEELYRRRVGDVTPPQPIHGYDAFNQPPVKAATRRRTR
jgi:hypothetical protein